MNNSTQKSTSTSVEAKKRIQSRVIKLVKYNYNQKELSDTEMKNKIKKIIETEVDNDNKTVNPK